MADAIARAGDPARLVIDPVIHAGVAVRYRRIEDRDERCAGVTSPAIAGDDIPRCGGR